MKNKLEKNISKFSQDTSKYGGYVYTRLSRLSATIANQTISKNVLSLVPLRGITIIDVGCGDGTYTQELYRLGRPKHIFAFDPSVEAIKSAIKANRYKKKITYKVGDVYDIPTDKRFDVAVVRGVLHHLYRPREAMKVLSQIAETVILVEPNGYNPVLKIIEKTSRYHIDHEEKSYPPLSIDGWIKENGGEVSKRRFAGLVPFFCPDTLAKILKFVEPIIEKLPVVREMVCANYYVVYRSKKPSHFITTSNSSTGSWEEIYRYRELMLIFAWRDISVKFKQSILGVGWVIIQPLGTMLIFTYFFGKISKIPSQGINYSVFVLTGLVFWGLFSNIVSHSSNSMVDNENIIKKVYFPKIIIPLSSIVSSLPDFIINLSVLLILAVIYGERISLFTPLYLSMSFVLTVIFALGFGLFSASANVRFRDVRYALPFVLQLLMYTSPIIFPLNILSSTNQVLLAVNPLTAAIDTARHSFMSDVSPDFKFLLISSVTSLIVLIFGLSIFQKTQRHFSDLV